MNSSLIVEKFDEWRGRSRPVALVTVFDTRGSTYSKPGHRILIADAGDYQGLVSGGCLEGDLAEHAARVLDEGTARVVSYDLRDDADGLFGLGIGCDGLLRVLVQPMSPANAYAPFAAIAAAMGGTDRAAVATVIEPPEGTAAVTPGATLVRTAAGIESYQIPAAMAHDLTVLCDLAIETGDTRLTTLDDGTLLLVGPLMRVPRLLVLGAGIDAIPLLSFARQLGWHVHIADHRPAYLERAEFAKADALTRVVPGEIGSSLPLTTFDAVVVMSHHLATDEAYLSELKSVKCRYVGVLGPAMRRRKLLDAIAATGTAFERYLRGPVGLDLGADSPETIALSIVAEIQLTLGVGSARGPADPH